MLCYIISYYIVSYYSILYYIDSGGAVKESRCKREGGVSTFCQIRLLLLKNVARVEVQENKGVYTSSYMTIIVIIILELRIL